LQLLRDFNFSKGLITWPDPNQIKKVQANYNSNLLLKTDGVTSDIPLWFMVQQTLEK
jgi:hypothetical protein